jgi:hypothetical protein
MQFLSSRRSAEKAPPRLHEARLEKTKSSDWQAYRGRLSTIDVEALKDLHMFDQDLIIR